MLTILLNWAFLEWQSWQLRIRWNCGFANVTFGFFYALMQCSLTFLWARNEVAESALHKFFGRHSSGPSIVVKNPELGCIESTKSASSRGDGGAFLKGLNLQYWQKIFLLGFYMMIYIDNSFVGRDATWMEAFLVSFFFFFRKNIRCCIFHNFFFPKR